ncbi:MAG: DEAD/DEAH box helicase family protein [Candidatus Thorarchaeota archaeon]|nr:MAG: DEAD/DEAH box helicase family protein [Candidatus Thorarchaeota archaeon]
MPSAQTKYTPRGYQNYILDRISSMAGTNLLLELDCGLGKRFITHQIVAERFPETRIIIVVHSSSSLAETMDYLRSEYGGLEDDLGELSSRVRSPLRPIVLREKRVVVATPQILARMVEKEPSLLEAYDMILINEVDTIIKRTGGRTTVVFPWRTILGFFAGKWIIGMSGTLRDDHAVFTEEQLEIRNELRTLREQIPESEVISMEDLYGTDVEEHIEPTFLTINLVTDVKIRSILVVLDELIRNTRQEILQELDESGNLDLVEGDVRRIHLMIERLPISDELKSRYSGLLLIRKYVYAMPANRFLRMFHTDYLKRYFNVAHLHKSLSEISLKTLRVLEIAKQYRKTVVLSSYLEMVAQIEETLTRAGLSTITITGQTRDKGEILREFRENEDVEVLVMSPVGERDLDIPQADVMVVCDTISTSKTMYQKFKRTRGGLVLLLAYQGTSEVRKVQALLDSILERYPWSSAQLVQDSKL